MVNLCLNFNKILLMYACKRYAYEKVYTPVIWYALQKHWGEMGEFQ